PPEPVPPDRRGSRELPLAREGRATRAAARRGATRARPAVPAARRRRGRRARRRPGAGEAAPLRGDRRAALRAGGRAWLAARRRGRPLGRLGDARAARPSRPAADERALARPRHLPQRRARPPPSTRAARADVAPLR